MTFHSLCAHCERCPEECDESCTRQRHQEVVAEQTYKNTSAADGFPDKAWAILHAASSPLPQSQGNISHVPDLGFDFFVGGVNVRYNVTVEPTDITLVLGGHSGEIEGAGSSDALSLFLAPNRTETEQFGASSFRSGAADLVVARRVLLEDNGPAYLIRFEFLDHESRLAHDRLVAVVEYTLCHDNTIIISVGKTRSSDWQGTFVMRGAQKDDSAAEPIASVALGSLSSAGVRLNKACGCPRGLVRHMLPGKSDDIWLETQDACQWDVFPMPTNGLSSAETSPVDAGHDGAVIALSSSGCQELSDLALPPKRPGLQLMSEVTAFTSGLWEMALDAESSSMRVQNFTGQYNVKCESGCLVQRAKTNCGEAHDTLVYPAGIRDRVDQLGAAVLLGPPCKGALMSDWDMTPAVQDDPT